MVFSTNDNDEKLIESLIKVKFLDYEVVSVKKLNRGALIEVSLYHKTRLINLEDCEKVTVFLMSSPDFADKFGQEPSLSVTSPGLEKKLTSERELTIFQGLAVRVVFLNEKNKTERIIGILDKNESEVLVIKQDENIKTIPKDSIKKIRLYYNWAS